MELFEKVTSRRNSTATTEQQITIECKFSAREFN